MSRQNNQVAVLVSGGADSAILCADLKARFDRVHPIYVRFGLQWEDIEVERLKSFLSAIQYPGLAPLAVLHEPVVEMYGDHWSTGKNAAPGADSPDEAVYLPGRNLMLLSKAAIWCQFRGITTIMLGSLKGNPFSDSTPEFDRAMEQVLALGLETNITIERPYLHLTKAVLLQRGAHLPLALTFSCIQPVNGEHCGECNKCGERQRAFRDAGIIDNTKYATQPPRDYVSRNA